MLGGNLKASSSGNEETTSTGGSVHQITLIPKNWQDFLTIIDDNKLFHNHSICCVPCQLGNNNHILRSGVAWGKCDNTLLYGRSSVLPACNMPSFVPCLHEEAGTRILLVLRKQLKGLTRK